MPSLETALGSLRDVPSALIGWLCLALMAGFLLYIQTQTQVSKMDEIVRGQREHIYALDRLTQKIEYFERVRLDLDKHGGRIAPSSPRPVGALHE